MSDGGFIAFPGLPPEKADELMQRFLTSCVECGAIGGTHFPNCSLEDRKPIRINMTPRTMEDICRSRGISEETLKRELGDKYVGPS